MNVLILIKLFTTFLWLLYDSSKKYFSEQPTQNTNSEEETAEVDTRPMFNEDILCEDHSKLSGDFILKKDKIQFQTI